MELNARPSVLRSVGLYRGRQITETILQQSSWISQIINGSLSVVTGLNSLSIRGSFHPAWHFTVFRVRHGSWVPRQAKILDPLCPRVSFGISVGGDIRTNTNSQGTTGILETQIRPVKKLKFCLLVRRDPHD